MKPALLVLAAGMGSRYGGLKQIDPSVRPAKSFWTIPFTMRSKADSAKSFS